jgi:hypothetical protein
MTDYLNYYGRNWEVGQQLSIWGYAYLGPTLVPPVPPTVGMLDRNGTGVTYYLMWDGTAHLVLTDQPPRAFYDGRGIATGQDVRVYGPYDGPYIGATGWRLGVTTAAPSDLSINGKSFPGGVPRLQIDQPNPQSGAGYTSFGPSLVAPDINGPQVQSYPEPSNYPAPGIPNVPGIPSTTPPPTGGGLSAFLAAYQTNQPPLILLQNVPPETIGSWVKVVQPWHLQHLGG